MATLEEAERCPKCKFPGEETSVLPAVNNKGVPVKQHIYMCRNDRCSWLDTGWTVTELPDGSVPDPKAGPKQFPALTPGQEAAARRRIEDAMQADLRDRNN